MGMVVSSGCAVNFRVRMRGFGLAFNPLHDKPVILLSSDTVLIIQITLTRDYDGQ